MQTFSLDPYAAALKHAERKWSSVVLAIMKKQGITQIDLSEVDINECDKLTLIHNERDRFVRIKGQFQLEDIQK